MGFSAVAMNWEGGDEVSNQRRNYWLSRMIIKREQQAGGLCQMIGDIGQKLKMA